MKIVKIVFQHVMPLCLIFFDAYWLMPSQHACADHYAPWYEGFLNENIKLITDYTLKNKFYNCAFVAGGRFDTFKD